MCMQPIITLTTDFGTRDSYVGVMKGIILGICPDARLVDITHEIPAQNVAAAALVVKTYVPYFPPGTVHLVVVDPGVGSARRALALATPEARFVGPDNGVFSTVWRTAHERWGRAAVQAVELTEPRFWRPQVSATFHGRDIFAPVAAHLAAGVALAELGPRLDTLVEAPVTEPEWGDDGSLRGQVVYIDHFGNCISNITSAHLERLGADEDLQVAVGNRPVGGVRRTYADVEPGTSLALLESNGRLEIAVRNGNASQLLGIVPGELVSVRRAAG